MACNICGFAHPSYTGGCPNQGMGVVEYERFMFPPTPIGWACPVCNKGNAPDAKTCGHCAQVTITCRPPWGATDEEMKEVDMDRGG